ncbi:hypothetical protein D3C81_1459930 [compost metagenome]
MAGSAVAVTKVPVEINSACFDLGTAIFKKTGGLGVRAGTHQQQAGNSAPKGERKRGKHAREHPEKGRKQCTANARGADRTRPNNARPSQEMIARRRWPAPLDHGLEMPHWLPVSHRNYCPEY